MLTALAALTAFRLATLLQRQPPPGGAWGATDLPSGSYAMDSSGSIEAGSARLGLHARQATDQSAGSVFRNLAADTLRVRRVVVTARVRGHGTASLFLMAANPAAKSYATAGSALGPADTVWTPHTLQLIVPRTAAIVTLGVSARGRSDIEVQDLSLTVHPLPPASTPLAREAQRELDSALTLARRNAYWRDTVTWAAVERDVRAFAAGASTASEVYPAIRELLARLGDHHSFLMPAGQAQGWRDGTATANPPPTVAALGGGVGYVSVPAFSGGSAAAARSYALAAHERLGTVAPNATCGWVVDLRQNGGGNMWPMLAGLQPLLGRGPLGTFVGPQGASAPWIAGADVDVAPPASLRDLDTSAVAVLLGPRTASSGEAVAVAFHGRARTRFFGQPTAGLANANGTFSLPDGAIMMVMTSVDADRDGHRFGEKVTADESIGAPTATSAASADDPVLAAATRWLATQPGCR